nr:hypothetical protein [uncultured Methanoregula sp.]
MKIVSITGLVFAVIPDIEIQVNKRQYLPAINNTRPAIPDIKVRINKRVPAMVIREIVNISWNVPDTDGGDCPEVQLCSLF